MFGLSVCKKPLHAWTKKEESIAASAMRSALTKRTPKLIGHFLFAPDDPSLYVHAAPNVCALSSLRPEAFFIDFTKITSSSP